MEVEFTYQGIVREAYGFHNPNHAAATIVILLPLLWGLRRMVRWRILKVAFLALELVGYGALAYTFSRSGVLTLAVSAAAWVVLASPVTWRDVVEKRLGMLWQRKWPILLSLLLVTAFVGISFYAGSFDRYSSTGSNEIRSTTNRFALWSMGLQLLADNPAGVGAGNSGKVISAIYLEDLRTSYRTMVNSFLTIAVEYGLLWFGLMVAAWIWIGLLLLRVWKKAKDSSRQKTQALAAMLLAMLIAISLSGLTSTCFDLNMFGTDEPIYTQTSDRLQRGLCYGLLLLGGISLLLCGLVLRKEPVSRHLKTSAIAILGSGLCVAMVFFAGRYFESSDRTVTVHRDTGGTSWVEVRLDDSGMKPAILLVSTTENPQTVRLIATETIKLPAYMLPLDEPMELLAMPQQYPDNPVVLFGRMSTLAPTLAETTREVILYKPETLLDPTMLASVRRVYLYQWDRHGDNSEWEQMARECPFEIVYVSE